VTKDLGAPPAEYGLGGSFGAAMDGQEKMDIVAFHPKIEPIIPTSAPPAHRAGWVYEEKVDGWRIVAYKDGSHVRLIGRRGVDHRSRFSNLAEAIAVLPATSLILDGGWSRGHFTGALRCA
jgi:ATP-dependent DNA ligase